LPSRWKFTDAEDVAAYGDRWWTWDEPALTRLRARQLIEIERRSACRWSTSSRSSARWGRRWVRWPPCGSRCTWPVTTVAWADFNPFVFATVWGAVPEAPLDSGEGSDAGIPSSPEPTDGVRYLLAGLEPFFTTTA
jgi:hypothetical protein